MYANFCPTRPLRTVAYPDPEIVCVSNVTLLLEELSVNREEASLAAWREDQIDKYTFDVHVYQRK